MKKLNFKPLLSAIAAGILCILLIAIIFPAKFNPVAADGKINSSENEVIKQTEAAARDFADDEVIVVLDKKISKINKIHSPNFFKGIKIKGIKDLTERKLNKKSKRSGFNQILLIKLKDGTKEKVLKAIDIIEQIDGVHSAEPNYFIEATAVSNDPFFQSNQLWNLNSYAGINAPSAWDYTTGNKNVRVGIIDSGIASHTDLNANVTDGYDFYNNNSVTTDDELGHGTKVAGIIGAIGNNAEGVAGINWSITMVPLQVSYYVGTINGVVYNRIMFNSSSTVNAINWATDLWGTDRQIDILNYSGGTFGDGESKRIAISHYPGLFVWSAGNTGTNVDSYAGIESYNLDNLISVGALDKNLERSVWSDTASSCYGNAVNVYAPGGNSNPYDNIITTKNLDNKYAYFNGTSAAAPHVAGVAALMLSVNPDLTAKQLKALILERAQNIEVNMPDTGEITVYLLNAGGAVKYVNDNLGSYLVFFDMQGGYDGTSKLWFKENEPLPLAVKPWKSRYNFAGYYTEDDVLIYDSEMNRKVDYWSNDYGDTLYAKWTAR